jgi:ribonuclease Z
VSLKFGGLELEAFSISGLATYVLAPAFDACFDLGHCPVEATKLRNVFLSHVHQDHAGGVPRHFSLRAMFGARPSRVYCPAESAEALRDVLRAWERLEEKPALDLDAHVRGLAPGDTVDLGRRYTVRAFDVVHRIASRGYTVIENRKVLRAEYQGLPGVAVHAARLRGETVSDDRPHPVFTYVGDHTAETLRRHPELGQSDVLFLEATHLADTPRSTSAQYGHTHLDDLVDVAREVPEALATPHIVLKHFSMKYDARDIRKAVAALPADLRRRVTVLLED